MLIISLKNILLKTIKSFFLKSRCIIKLVIKYIIENKIINVAITLKILLNRFNKNTSF
jgi:hypothetical protein